MWEIDIYQWTELRGVSGDPANAPAMLRELAASDEEEHWREALAWVDSFASDLGIPSGATSAVVACLIGLALRVEGAKRTAILESLEDLTCGRGIETYSAEELGWLEQSVAELACAMHVWLCWAESAPPSDAARCVELLAYCGVYVPALRPRVRQYLSACAAARPELGEDVVAIRANFEQACSAPRKAPDSPAQ